MDKIGDRMWFIRALPIFLLIATGGDWLVPRNACAAQVTMADPSPTGRRIDYDGLVANYYPGPRDRQSPAILLIGGSEGGLGRFMNNYALALQRSGYGVLHLSFWRAPGQSERLEQIPIEYFERGLAWLRAQPDVDPERLAMAGWSRGSEAAVLVGSRDNGLKALILGMPASHVFEDYAPEHLEIHGTSAWSINGDALPAVLASDLPDAMDTPETTAAFLAALEEAPAAALPIAQVNAPVLMICGEMDIIWPSCPMARVLKTSAEQHAKKEILLIAYERAGHVAFGAPAAMTSTLYPDLAGGGGESVEANQAALEDGFAETIAFLKRHL